MDILIKNLDQIFIALKEYLIFINIIFAFIIIFFERRKPVYTQLWVVILLLTSYFGFLMYLFFGLKFKKRYILEKYYTKNRKKINNYMYNKQAEELKKWERLTHYLDKILLNKVTFENELTLYEENERYFEEIKNEIKKAKESIYMEYYIFDDDEVGKPIYDLLVEKAKENIEIKIIVDGAGTRKLGTKRKKELKSVGIDLVVFFPSYFPFIKLGNLRANYRNHRKIAIIDREICFSGGLNIGEDYVGKGRLGNWRDLGFSIKGEAIADYLYEFERDLDFIKKDKKDKYEEKIVNRSQDIVPIHVVSSGPNYEFKAIKNTIMELVIKAEKKIVIQTPYFVPDESILELLKIALVSGVEVIINIPSIPDHAFVYWANQYFYGELITHGAKIYKYKDGFIHTKLVIIDDEVAFVGTANFDYRSQYQNFEINILVYGEKVLEFSKRVKKDLENSKFVELSEYKKRGKLEKVRESISKLVAPIL